MNSAVNYNQVDKAPTHNVLQLNTAIARPVNPIRPQKNQSKT